MERSITAFLGSPSDVDEERRLAREVAADVDVRNARPLGWSVRAVGWEQVLPGLGRAQEQINRGLLDECNLFVGIVNVRWGTATGDYTSGFEEELARVRERWEAGEDIAVFIYLRELEEGADLDAAMAKFRDEIRSAALYHTFSDPEDFASHFRTHLTQLLTTRAGQAHRDELEQVSQRETQALPGGTVLELPPGGTQDAARADAVTAAHAQQEPEAGETPPGTAQVADAIRAFAGGDSDAATLVRAHLALAARMSAELTGAVLDVHDVNRLYEHRDGVELTESEETLILRTAAAHGWSAPLWGLLVIGDEQEAAKGLARVMLNDREAYIRAGAAAELGVDGLQLLAAMLDENPELTAAALYERLLRDDSDEVAEAAIAALPDDMPETVPILRQLLDEGRHSVKAFRRLLDVLCATDPPAALELATGTPAWVEERHVDALGDQAETLPADQMKAILAGGSADAKVIALRILEISNRVTLEAAELLTDSSPRVRRAAVAACTAAGAKISPSAVDAILKDDSNDAILRSFTSRGPSDEELRIAQFRLLGAEERAQALNWLNLRGGDALAAAVASDDEGAAELARRSLGDHLGQVRTEHIAAEMERAEGAGKDAAGSPENLAEQYRSLFDHLWQGGALTGLAALPELTFDDATLAAAHLERYHTRGPAARVLAVAGTAEHLDDLIRAAASAGDDELRDAVLRRAAYVAGPDEVLERIVDGDSARALLQPMLCLIADDGERVDTGTLRGLIAHKQADVRRAALRALILPMDDAELCALLNEHASARQRYYDIVGILDRMVHGPAFVRALARRELGAP
ncbi:MAG: hypothetical protein QOG70_3783 [Solirubrobacteraceae bacterium]|nr:hypothetical protein [Solirubrobacteraceae bacterium]